MVICSKCTHPWWKQHFYHFLWEMQAEKQLSLHLAQHSIKRQSTNFSKRLSKSLVAYDNNPIPSSHSQKKLTQWNFIQGDLPNPPDVLFDSISHINYLFAAVQFNKGAVYPTWQDTQLQKIIVFSFNSLHINVSITVKLQYSAESSFL